MKIVVLCYLLSNFCVYFFPGHLEKHFNIAPEDWKQIQIHIDSKCRSAYRCKSRGLPQTVQGFHRQATEQTSDHIRGLESSFAETYSNDAALQPQQNFLIEEVS